MNAEPTGSDAPARHRLVALRGMTLALISVALLVLALVVCTTPSRVPEQKLIWLSQAQFRAANGAGPLTRLKYKIMNIIAPLSRHFQPTKRQVLIQTSFVAVSAEVAQRSGLGGPIATNADGTMAWILSPLNLAAFQKLLREAPASLQLGSPRIQTFDGMQAGIFVGSAPGSAPGIGDLGVDVTATILSAGMQLLVKVQATETNANTPGSGLKTNLAAACRAVVPNAGGLVLLANNPTVRSATNVWLIFSPGH